MIAPEPYEPGGTGLNGFGSPLDAPFGSSGAAALAGSFLPTESSVMPASGNSAASEITMPLPMAVAR